MWIYQKTIQHPVNIKTCDPRMAKFLITQFGGPNGELAASLRYLSQRYTMPTGNMRALLTDIGTEELAHVEVICAMVYQLTSDASPEELKAAGLGSNYAQNGYGLYPTDSNGVPFDVRPIAVMSNPVTDLHEDMAAEQKALATYYQLINLTDDVDVINVLKFLGQREIIHYQRFGEALMDAYELEESQKIF
ncbi:manganese catalase family protein [Clostridioides sp. ES-S-0108-01]|uniref:manganese catalase family protein n=1 Tax=unclassified Clostridioides TaxID=2635829 RepID=UPI001D0C9A49|nr:manganese catalase family protein [Clostridioides sp. ES-S-0171-01]MCC0687715.1 manganese catalase family protein [Clostridioides sp. ES-S-0056-01]MCC0716075.1 manganese catalase family protein [Clostridioides sp. ES-S-0077-01]MCC0781611.1 manganese catalase family protein [Clostridioides sp. ES-S-0108-01]UDN50083.1 manganese catalase family protein [Clostridioides sp. ES-S-0107-01]UDN53550.1 manganese catalase family protein [Clostridioides sp. ES-S-0054-01]